MLRLISDIETIALQAEINANLPDNDLPPPIPVEAKMSWLSGIATPKSELPKRSKDVELVRHAAPPKNAWEGLPMPAPRIPAPVSEGLPYAPNYRFIFAKFDSHCHSCEDDISQGDLILWYPSRKSVYCSNCDEFRASNVERMAHGLSDVRTWRQS